ncbi:MAG: HAMP domain-containing histidine kinase [Bacteroidetes bacterium]|nr:HAMP domain-containing histidine kinase [Bacteroidota bacterium]
MKNLLQKQLKPLTVFAFIVFALSIPTYFLLVNWIWLKELDENNKLIAQRIENEFNEQHISEEKLAGSIAFWNDIQSVGKIEPVLKTFRKDSVYTIRKQNRYSKQEDIDQFRILITNVKINNGNFTLTIETNMEENEETVAYIAIVTLLFFLILVVGFWVLNKRLSQKLWQPFRNTLEKLKSFDLTTQQTVSFDKTDIEEFEELNQSLQKLIDKNISVYNQQKTFIENASHELQTPLAVLKSKMDLLLQNKNITNEQSEILSAIELPLARMTRINKNLLLLAKIENNQFADKENIEVTELINETLELLTDYISAKQITVNKNLAETLTLTCNKTLLEILISNLFINAIVHNVENGKINIDFSAKTLTVSNTGKTALDNKKIFDRFSVSSSKTANSGLGLAIVKEICNRYGWHINYSFENNFHSFSVQF